MAAGTPEEVAAVEESYTGHYLASCSSQRRPRRSRAPARRKVAAAAELATPQGSTPRRAGPVEETDPPATLRPGRVTAPTHSE